MTSLRIGCAGWVWDLVDEGNLKSFQRLEGLKPKSGSNPHQTLSPNSFSRFELSQSFYQTCDFYQFFPKCFVHFKEASQKLKATSFPPRTTLKESLYMPEFQNNTTGIPRFRRTLGEPQFRWKSYFLQTPPHFCNLINSRTIIMCFLVVVEGEKKWCYKDKCKVSLPVHNSQWSFTGLGQNPVSSPTPGCSRKWGEGLQHDPLTRCCYLKLVKE